jgi:hypothetical protein
MFLKIYRFSEGVNRFGEGVKSLGGPEKPKMWGLWDSKQPKADAASEAMHGKRDDTIKIYQTI